MLYTGGFKKCFWSLVMMGMAAALMYSVVELTKKYLEYPVSVKMNVDHKQKLTFPAVTVCNMNPVKRSAWLAAQYVPVKRRRKRSTGRPTHTDSYVFNAEFTCRTGGL